MSEWDEAESEVLAALTEPVTTLNELYDRYLPTVASRLWTTCYWPERMADGWRIGDFKFLVISLVPEPKTQLYVQFWSEPHEPVVMEVCSGERSPRSVKYVQEPQRQLLQANGFRIGGAANNYSKDVAVASVADAEALAKQSLRLLFEAFDYRGQWPLELSAERGRRGESTVVHHSLTPRDFAKLLAEHGFIMAAAPKNSAPAMLVQRGRRRFSANLDRRVARSDLYGRVTFRVLFRPPRVVTDDALVALNAALPAMAANRHESRYVHLSMPLSFQGGVTEAWIMNALKHWLAGVRYCERLLRGDRDLSEPAIRTKDHSSVH